MSYKIDFRTMPNNMPSLCIPRTFSNINEKMVFDSIMSLQIGQVSLIEVIPQMNAKGEKYNKIFIHFHYWFNNQNACKAREYVMTGKELKIIYRDPWFWKVSALRIMKPVLNTLTDSVKINNINNINNQSNINNINNKYNYKKKSYVVKSTKEELDKELDEIKKEQDKLLIKIEKDDIELKKEIEYIKEKNELYIQMDNIDEDLPISIPINYGKIAFPKNKKTNKKVLVIESV